MSKKPPIKSKEEKLSENYFPVDEDDLKYTTSKETSKSPEEHDLRKHTTEKAVRTIEREQVLSPATKTPPKRKYSRRKTPKSKTSKNPKRTKKASTTKKPKTFSAPKKSKLSKEGYELVITEKPQAAGKIAQALGDAVQKSTKDKVPYYEVNRDGKQIVVACAVGHLFTLKQMANMPAGEPVFNIDWVPNWQVRKKDFSKKYYDAISRLCKDASSLTVATDYDIEGEVIGINVVKFICGEKDAARMKFSTLTNNELNKAYDEKSKTINWNHAIAGETRHYLDWFYGINLSRNLMNAIKTTGSFRIMSIGRVQGPALNFIVQREREIENFKPETYWQAFITIQQDGVPGQLVLKHNKDIFDEAELKNFENLKGKLADATTRKSQQSLPPNPPFNLTTLQTEAYKLYGITPSKTLQIAQGLYLAGLISYPRTSSQKLPESLGYKSILKKVAKAFDAEKYITKSKPIEGPKSDPAHPSIHPTGNTQTLTGQDEKIYNLIARRFLALFCDNAKIDKKTVTATPQGSKLDFKARGSKVVDKGWMAVYPTKLKDVEIEDYEGEVNITDEKIEEKETQPPKRYSPASILSELEKRNLGTKATRANILETLYSRGYIQDQSIKATALGMSLIATLEKHSPIIIDEDLTRNFEKDMEEIEEAKKKSDLIKEEEEILSKAKTTITGIHKDFEKSKVDVGKELLDANLKHREAEKVANQLVECPKCKKGQLAITYSKKNRRHFIACNAYPECKTTYSLPPNGIIKKTDKLCDKCSFPLMMSLRTGKKPWFFCFNNECETNKERMEAYRAKMAEKG